MRERFDELRAMGIRSVMITGDNPITARVIAAEAGVDDVLAEATPEDKLALIRREQEGGRMVAMCGDGTNDAPALAQADVGVAMNTGTTAAKEAGNMVDLDSDPTKLIDVVEIGKQLLITRGALTTFSVANDVAKYFAILPAMFVVAFPDLDVLNVMRLSSSGVGDRLRGRLQRADHRRADPAVAARRALHAVLRLGPAEAQPAGLRRRRPGGAVRRDQAPRPGHLAHPRPLSRTGRTTQMNDLYALFRQSLAGLRVLILATIVLRRRLPPARDGHRRGRLPVAGQRLADHRGRLPHHRPRPRPSARRSSASSRPRGCSSRGPRLPATATTRCRRPAPTTVRRPPS